MQPPGRGQLAGSQGFEGARDIGRQAHPANTRGRARRGYREPLRKPPSQIWEVDSGASSDRVPRPHAPVDVEQLVLPVPGIVLELDLEQPGPVQGGDDGPPELRHAGIVHRLHQRARVPEVTRVLPQAAGGQRRDDGAVVAQRGERVLVLPGARDQLLDHHRFGSHQPGRLLPRAQQRGAIVHPPRLGPGEPVLVGLGVRLEDDRKPAGELSELGRAARIARPRMSDPDPPGELVGEALVVGLAHGAPAGRGEGKAAVELVSLPGERRDRLVGGWKQRPAHQAVTVGDLQQSRPLLLRAPRGRGQRPGDIPRGTGHRIVAGLVQHPAVHAPASEAPGDPEPTQVGADDQCAGPRAHGTGPEPTVAITEVPAITRSPSLTRTHRSRRVGSTTSTCEPSRMTPMRWPTITSSPSPT